MKIQAILNSQYTKNCKPRCNSRPNVSLAENEQISFKGVKGTIKGGAVGAAAALTVAAVAGPFGLAILPLWTTLGGIIGHSTDDNKPKNPDGEDNTKS